MEPQPTGQPEVSPQTIAPMPKNKTTKIVLIIVSVLAALVVLPFLVFGVIGLFTGGSAATNELFLETLSNASQKTKVQQLTSYKIWEAGASTSSEPAHDELSLTGFDSATGTFATINAAPTAVNSAEKCLEGKPHAYRATDDTRQAAIDALNNPNAEEKAYANPNGPYSPCNINDSRRVGKFSDGIIPVGLTAQQAASWLGYLKERGVFEVKDEGEVEHKGVKVRKLSFTLAKKLDSSALFYAVRDGDTGKSEGSGIKWKTGFGMQLSQNLTTPTGLKGFYLVDEKMKLPMYSEVSSAQLEGKSSAQTEAYAQKVEYEYPGQISITKETKLADL
jgi:hypothetical protein